MATPAEAEHYRYRVTFPEDNFEVVRALAQERITLSLRQQKDPAPSDKKILGMAEPYLLVNTEADLFELAERLDEFVDRTDYAVTDIAMELPQCVAEGLVEERREQSAKAQAMALALRTDIEWMQMLPQDAADFDSWAQGLDSAD